MATGTLIPSPYQTVEDANGKPVSGALVNTYVAGTTTPATTYSDVSLTTPNSNPIVADSAGRWSCYLTPGASYKLVIQNPDSTSIRTIDNIGAVPPTSINLDVAGVAGEALTAGQAVYLSDGSGSKVAGQWYKADSANTYSSINGPVGMVPAAIASGSSGTIRLSGQVTGLAGLVVGSQYFIGSAGAITVTAPANRRYVGTADSTTSIVLVANPPDEVLNPVTICDGRLTLTTGVPVTTSDVTAATTLYYTPYVGNRIYLYDGTASWNLRSFSEFSIAIPATSSQMYDVFVFDNSGTPALELLAWTNDTTRATALVRQDGVLVKTGATTRRYVGSVRTTTVSGQTEDSAAKRYLFNFYNKATRPLRVTDTTDTWTYTTATLRQANGAATNQVDLVVGQAEEAVYLRADHLASNSNATPVSVLTGIGLDGTTTQATGCIATSAGADNGRTMPLTATLTTIPAVGRHFFAWLEFSGATGTTTWYGDSGGTVIQTGLSGFIRM